jgi:hypothetical protein
MGGQYTDFRNSKPILAVGIVGFVLAALFCRFDGRAAQGCQFIERTAWVAFELLRAAILAASWHPISAYLHEDSCFMNHLLQIGASLWPILCVLLA